MAQLDQTPALLEFKQVKGITWLYNFQLMDQTTGLPINLSTYNIVCVIENSGGVLQTLYKTSGITLASDNLGFTVRKDWVSWSETGVPTPTLQSLPKGLFTLKIILSGGDGVEISPIFIKIEVVDEASAKLTTDANLILYKIFVSNGFAVSVDALSVLSLIEALNTEKSFLKASIVPYSDLEKKVLNAIRVLDITVSSDEKADDWRITFVTTIPTTAGLVANFKYRVQIRNLTKGKDYALISENSTFDATTLNGYKSYDDTVSNGGTSVKFNIQIDWNYLLGLGATFEFNLTTSNLKLKTGIFSQKADIVKLIDAGDANLKNIIDNGRYDFILDKTKSFTTNENHILRAIKLLDITVPSSEKTDDWRITFVSTIPSTAGLVANFKYRVQIRNLTKAKDYSLINENLTFDATTLNGYKSYSDTVTNAGTSVKFNIQIDWNYLLSLGETFEYNSPGTSNLWLKKGVFSQLTEIKNRLDILEALALGGSSTIADAIAAAVNAALLSSSIITTIQGKLDQIAGFRYEISATYATVSTNTLVRLVFVQSDSNNGGNPGLYFHDGSTLKLLLLL